MLPLGTLRRPIGTYVAPAIWRWIIFITSCYAVLYPSLALPINALTYIHPPQPSIFTPYQGLLGQPVSELGPCIDNLGPCSDLSPQMGYHNQSNFTTQIHLLKGPIRTISVHAENGIITSMRFSCKGVEIADVVALWHRPDRITVEMQHYLAYWDSAGVLAEGHLHGTFDYHASVESMTYVYLPDETD